MPKRIFIINGHPGETSLSHNLVDQYIKAAEQSGHDVRVAHLQQLSFDSDFGEGGYKNLKPLEPALKKVMSDLEWSEHIVLATPMWWGGIPAKLKGLFDRILLPGHSFNPRKLKYGLPEPLLKGRTARIILTSDTKSWLLRLVYHNALINQLKCQIFSFIGVKPTHFTQFAPASHPTEQNLEKWFSEVRYLGALAT